MAQSFTQRIASQIREHAHEVVFVASSDAGVPYILQTFREQEALCVWLKLEADDADDAVIQGNKLSEAVKKAFGSQLFGQAMSYRYGLSILKDNLALFEPITFMISGAEHGQAFATDLLSLQTSASKVILAFETMPNSFLLPEKALVLQDKDLRLSLDEALQIVQARLSETEVSNLLRLQDSKLEPFLVELNKCLNLPAPMRPGPQGAEAIPGLAISLPPAIHLQMLLRKEQFIEAFEIAVQHLPEKALELLERAGNSYMNKGLYKRFDELIYSLPRDLQETEAVFNWQVRVAKRLGTSVKLRDKIKAYLEQHEAPDLRAQYASHLASFEESFVQAQKAYETQKSFLTLLHYCVSLQQKDPAKAVEVSHELIEFSKLSKNDWYYAQGLSSAGSSSFQLGRYTEASYFYEEALKAFDRDGSGDWQFRMHSLNNWAFVRMMIGETVGLGQLLSKEERALRDAYPALAFIFRSTLGDYYLSQKDPHRALKYYQENYDYLATVDTVHAKDFPPHVVRDLVQCLLHLDDLDKASQIARKHYFISKESDYIRIFNTLAYGMVKLFSQPEEALGLLTEVVSRFEQPLLASYLASAAIYLAKAHLLLGDRQAAKESLARAEIGLREISETGFRLLSGPEEKFREVFDLWQGREAPRLSLKLLGEPRVLIGNEVVHIFPKWLDILLLLALHPEGLTTEQLELEFSAEGAELGTIKAIISKLRKRVAISHSPYRITETFQADFVDLQKALQEGRLRAALELYRGALLERSQAPGVIEARENLQELLRQAVLESKDVEALLSLSEQFKDDLELWEAALNALPESDPRRSLALAKQRRVMELWDS